ncbi:PAS domain-containing protein [Azonexus sp.]|jgi:PAS domain S-box-containing protein|uniref:PAS domain-containing protein n=1 Tax=Azonexus sp. TaxID=1872668 RepID=UPI002837939A|nr:PAS domain-containing protein [Azonexus sp.]MDR1994633.1 PAS domain S-box protein [Azonexus sp.]
MLPWQRSTATAAPPEVSGRRPISGILFILSAIAWSLLVLVSLWLQREQLNRTAESLAKLDAITNLRKDMAIRKWASYVGGVYIKDDKVRQLETFGEQEIITGLRSNGESMKLVTLTPMHLLLAIQEISQKEYGIRERLTSQQLRNLANAPDEWEVKALDALKNGGEMISEAVPSKGGHGLSRVMIPMRMEKECLECHRDTLVPIGGLRGAAAISVDLNAYRTAQEPTWRTIQYWHFGIWLMGLATISFVWLVASRRAQEQTRQEEERRENETAFAAMAEGAIITNAHSEIIWVNNAFCRIYGYRRDEVIGKNPRLLQSGRHDRGFYEEFWRQLTQRGHWRGEIWNKRKTGEIFPEEISIQALRGPDGAIRRFISIFSDITERKRNEEELLKHQQRLQASEARLRELATFLQTLREEERTRIARELHDELGQALTALRLDLGWLRGKCDSLGSPAAGRVAAAFSVVEQSIVSLRRISEDLRPAMLDSLGLAAAVEHHVTQFEQRTGIRCRLAMNREEFDLDGKVATAVFRIVQEALTNVARHAKASEVSITLDETDGAIELVVTDNGSGIVAAENKKTFGLLGMRERITILGGSFDISSRPGQGTRISCRLPLQRDTQT